MNHRWKDTEVSGQQKCHKCGCLRKRHTFRQLMAIVGNRDVYRYECRMVYRLQEEMIWSTERPECRPFKINEYQIEISEKEITQTFLVKLDSDQQERFKEIIRGI